MKAIDRKKMDLSHFIRKIFDAVLLAVDAQKAVENEVQIKGSQLKIALSEFDLHSLEGIYVVSIGKAAMKMALAIDVCLGEKLKGGIISAPKSEITKLSKKWKIFNGGHPIPNDASLAAAQFAKELLQRVDREKTLLIFLISGGGSAMFEMPDDEKITLSDLQKANEILVTCGATISEINTLRRRISAIKGGGLSGFAPQSKKVSLIISDTNSNDAYNVASGLTIENQWYFSSAELQAIISRYQLAEKLPSTVFECLENEIRQEKKLSSIANRKNNFYVLLANRDALVNAEKNLEAEGFAVEIAGDLVEQEIGEGCLIGVERLKILYEKHAGKKPVAVISGGEFSCPVRGAGQGGRNLESALRTAILFDKLRRHEKYSSTKFSALFAGTDGIDGNSPAAGAVCDETTIKRGQKLSLDAEKYLNESDAYSCFHQLGDVVATGATGTNVRDVRILLAL